jgi:signal transduction histidine kinase/ActR/RegA family two-component response regulator
MYADAVHPPEVPLLWTLEEISRLASSSGSPGETLNNIVLLIQRRFKIDVCSVYLLEPDRINLVLAATIGLRPSAVGAIRMRLTEGLVGLTAQKLEAQVVANASAHPRFKYFPDAGEEPYHSFLGVPIIDRGIPLGVLVVQTLDARTYGQDEVLMLQTAGAQLAPIVSDARLEQRRAWEQEIVQQAKTELVQTLVGGIAHELNNKLMPVVGFAELAVDRAAELGDWSLQEYCRTILDSVLEASRIIRQLLELSKPTVAEHATCDLRAIVQQALKLVELRLNDAGIPLAVDLPNSPVIVNGDAGQLKQVFVNLVWNAIDAMEGAPAPHLTIRLRSSASLTTLSCIDCGPGIPPEVLPRIFDPFYTTKEPNRGTGLGLSVCLALIKQHKGDLRVQTTPGAGAAFHVVLPLETGPLIPAPRRPVATASSYTFQDRRVLVIDDEEAVVRVITHTLRSKLGCQIEGVYNGVEAIAALDRSEFDLILSDIRMPSMNGPALLGWLSAHRPGVLERTVFITGDASDSTLNSHIRVAKRPLLQKPFTIDTLLRIAKEILTLAPRPSA